ncbi:MAG: hypothetical protein AB8G05_12915 [Oligoflexales bacterium]
MKQQLEDLSCASDILKEAKSNPFLTILINHPSFSPPVKFGIYPINRTINDCIREADWEFSSNKEFFVNVGYILSL